jgi:hypothetical protein
MLKLILFTFASIINSIVGNFTYHLCPNQIQIHLKFVTIFKIYDCLSINSYRSINTATATVRSISTPTSLPSRNPSFHPAIPNLRWRNKSSLRLSLKAPEFSRSHRDKQLGSRAWLQSQSFRESSLVGTLRVLHARGWKSLILPKEHSSRHHCPFHLHHDDDTTTRFP